MTACCDISDAAISGVDHPFALPEIPCYLNELLACEDFYGGMEPRIGRKHIRVIAIDGFPRMSSPGILRELDQLPIEYRWNTRALLIDPEEARALLDKHRKKWRSKIRGWKDQILQDPHRARSTCTPRIWPRMPKKPWAWQRPATFSSASTAPTSFASMMTRNRLYENTRLVMKTIQNLGFSCRVEDVNAVEAWRGSLPGDGYSNVRRVLLHTLNLADMLPITSVWAGLRENPSALMPKHSPPLLYRGNERRHAVPVQSACLRPRAHADRRALRGRQIDCPRSDRGSVVPVSAGAGLCI